MSPVNKIIIFQKKKPTVLDKQIKRERAKKGATNPFIYDSLNPNFKTNASAIQEKFIQN